MNMLNRRWRMGIALSIAGVTEALVLLAGRAWILPLLNTTLSNLATAVGRARLGGGMLVYVVWLVLVPLVSGALAGRLSGRARGSGRHLDLLLTGTVCGAVSLLVDQRPGVALLSMASGTVGGWLGARVLLRGRSGRLRRGLRWVAGVLAGNVVGLLVLGGGLPMVVRSLTQVLTDFSGVTTGLPAALVLVLSAPMIGGIVGVWTARRPPGRQAALVGALSGLYTLSGATSLPGAIVAVLVMAGSAAGGLAARRVRPRERAWPYVLTGAAMGSGLLALLALAALVVVLPLTPMALDFVNAPEPPPDADTLRMAVLALIVAAPIAGGVASASIARRAYVRAAILSCALPALAVTVLGLLYGSLWFELLSVGLGVLGAGLGGVLVRLSLALQRRMIHPGVRRLSVGVRLISVGMLVVAAVLHGDCFPLPAQAIAARSVSPDQVKAFWAGHRPVLARAAALSPADLIQAYERPYRDRIDLDPTQAAFYNLVDRSLALTPAQEDLLRVTGFVVTGEPVYDSFGDAYEDIYRRDLPVFVTTDSILHALHKSYDDILADVERQMIIPELSGLLDGLEAQVGQNHLIETDPHLRPLLGELHRYLHVARALLADTPPRGDVEAAAWFERAREGTGIEQVLFFGEPRWVDWTRFQPAGRYAEDAQMCAYYRAMRWLGMMDWRLMTTDPETMETRFHPQQAAAALLLLDAVEEAQMLGRWQELDGMLTLFAGTPDGMDLPALQMLRADAYLDDPAAVFDPGVQARLVPMLQTNLYGVQQINAAVLFSDPTNPEPLPLPVSFALFQPRFTVDSYVFTNVVFDRVTYEGNKVTRAFPSPLDAMFVLGNDYAVTLLHDELVRYNYQGNLLAQRALVDGYDPAILTENLSGLWLQALRTLNNDTTAAPYPQVMQTAAWAAKATHTQLFSWAQLRHDAVLYVKQPATFAAICDYPAGYVEPYPSFYATLAAWARQGRIGFQQRHWSPQIRLLRDHILDYMDRLEATAGRLERLAQKELDGLPFTDEEEQFLRQVIVIKRPPASCVPVVAGYEGWYPQLFYAGPDQSDEADPTVAPVHTNLDGEIGPTGVLHVATGNVRLMVVAVDSGPDGAVYLGPVGSYYEFVEPLGTVLTDEMWEQRLDQDPPSPPAWWGQYGWH
jgi:hypothetical protein